jgi:hydroxymethylpyrimidine/phosphomethylpyrimidine kinase
MTAPARILAIAGSDSSGGAGIQADIKTITMLGGYAMTAITAITAQDTTGVYAVETMPPALVAAQIDACISDIGVDAVKIGMLGSPAIAELVAGRIDGLGVPVVFDPVMVATSGSALADPATIAGFERLMALATLTTPNVSELAALGGDAAMTIRGITYLAKGGDAEGSDIEDILIRPDGQGRVWRSSAIAMLLGAGAELEEAIDHARQYVRRALLAAPGFGAGNGPLGHYAAGRTDN